MNTPLKIIVTEQGGVYYAHLENSPQITKQGRTDAEAVVNLISSNVERFNIVISHIPEIATK